LQAANIRQKKSYNTASHRMIKPEPSAEAEKMSQAQKPVQISTCTAPLNSTVFY
jgi:hypothetical protein